jgi:hypothetical protein
MTMTATQRGKMTDAKGEKMADERTERQRRRIPKPKRPPKLPEHL